jgi:transposase
MVIQAQKLILLSQSRSSEILLPDILIIWLVSQGRKTPEIAKQLEVSERMVRNRLHRFNEQGLAGLEEAPRSGRPVTYTPEEVSSIIQTALSNPRDLGEDYASWTLDRLVDYLHRVKGIRMKRSRISEIFISEGLSWRHEETWFGERVDPDFAKKGGHRNRLHRASRRQYDGVSGSDGSGSCQKLPRQATGESRSDGNPTSRQSQARD